MELLELIEKWQDVLDTAESDDYYTLNLVKEFLDDLELGLLFLLDRARDAIQHRDQGGQRSAKEAHHSGNLVAIQRKARQDADDHDGRDVLEAVLADGFTRDILCRRLSLKPL